MLQAIAATALALSALLAGGCATNEPSALAGAHIPADQYAATFQAARDVLLDYRYTADRVDAPQGVLTSLPRSEPGLGKVWEARSGVAAAWDDLLNYRQRTVHVSFVTAAASARQPDSSIIPPTDPDRDLAAQPRDTTMLVRVLVEQYERPDRRVSLDSVRVTRQAVNTTSPQEAERGPYLATQHDDNVLAADILRAILDRTRHPAPAAQTPAAPALQAPAP
ncbi:MAG TPA: hypothetical protein VFF65_04735 [Phycisphaerales bacterium]|nr:hypothetical protein [Phycisphaerales bacterium]